MKKLLFLFAFVGFAAAAMAQSETPTQKYSVATNDFWSNWFVTAGWEGTAFYSGEETGVNFNHNPFKKFRNNMGFGVSVGKWFTPGVGTRVKFQGLKGKGVVSESNATNKRLMKDYFNIDGQVMFNLSNIFCGYNENRFWNVIVYPGAGFTRNMSDDQWALNLQAGLMNTFRITKRIDAFVDLNVTLAENKADGVNVSGPATQRLKFPDHDKWATAEVGLKYNIGKTGWQKTPDLDAINALNAEQVGALEASLKAAQNENAQLKASAQKLQTDVKKLQSELTDCRSQKKPVEAKTTVVNALETNVFFACGKSVITAAQMPNVARVASYLKNNPQAQVSIKGYASKEGPAKLNEKLADARAQAVKNMLIKKYGIDASRIQAKGEGIGNMFTENSWNRVAISTLTGK